MKRLSHNRLWFGSLVLVVVATLAVLFAPVTQANHDPQDRSARAWGSELPSTAVDQQVFNEDFTIESGEVVEDNVAVFRGDVEIEEGGILRGNLSVFGGDVQVSGTIEGDLAAIGGDVELEETARITGDVSAIGGDVERAPGAFVGGNFVGGPRANIQINPNIPDIEFGINRGFQPQSRSPFASFFLRLLQAVLWTLAITALVILIYWLFPRQVEGISQTAQDEPALSFAVGLIVSLGVLLVSFVLGITVILLCVSVLLMAILAVIALLGWAVTSVWLGQRLGDVLNRRTGTPLHPLIPISLSALILTGVTFFAWALLPCLGIIVGLLLGSVGVGAVIVHQARRGGFIGGKTNGPPGGAPGGTPPAPSPGGVTVTGDRIGGPSEQAAEQQSAARPPEETSDADLDVQSVDVTPPRPETGEVQVTGEAPAPPPQPDDFTAIKGVGPTFNQRLIDAGITSYAQLANLTAEELAEILGWPPDRVIRDQLREQAAELATRR